MAALDRTLHQRWSDKEKNVDQPRHLAAIFCVATNHLCRVQNLRREGEGKLYLAVGTEREREERKVVKVTDGQVRSAILTQLSCEHVGWV